MLDSSGEQLWGYGSCYSSWFVGHDAICGTEMPFMQLSGVMQAPHNPHQQVSAKSDLQPLQLQVGTCSTSPIHQQSVPQHDGGYGTRLATGYEQRPRLLPRAAQPMQGPFQLQPHPRGALTSLALVPHPTLSRPQGASSPVPHGCIVMQVKTVGVNFRDVLNVLGMYPGDPGMPGSDCSGVVTEVGVGVRSLVVGDNVVGLAEGSLGSHVVASAATVVRMPAHVNYAEAASLPTVCITADAALYQVGPGGPLLPSAYMWHQQLSTD